MLALVRVSLAIEYVSAISDRCDFGLLWPVPSQMPASTVNVPWPVKIAEKKQTLSSGVSTLRNVLGHNSANPTLQTTFTFANSENSHDRATCAPCEDRAASYRARTRSHTLACRQEGLIYGRRGVE